MQKIPVSIGEIVEASYDEFLRRFNDEELAFIATQIVLNELLVRQADSSAS